MRLSRSSTTYWVLSSEADRSTILARPCLGIPSGQGGVARRAYPRWACKMHRHGTFYLPHERNDLLDDSLSANSTVSRS